jgi:threonine/homoserine/homoserine lactone efflux protein
LFAIAALLGLHAVLLAVPVLPLPLKVVGGLYLAYLGLRIWRAARYRRRAKGAARWPEEPRQLSVRYTRQQCPLCFNLFTCY